MIAPESRLNAAALYLSRRLATEPRLNIHPSVDAAGLTLSLDDLSLLIDAAKRARGVLRITAFDACGQELGRAAVKLAMEADDWRHCAVPISTGTVASLRIAFDCAPSR